MVGVFGRDEVNREVGVPAHEFVVKPPRISVVLPVAFVTNLGVAKDVGVENVGKQLGERRLFDLRVLDLDLDVLLHVGEKFEALAVALEIGLSFKQGEPLADGFLVSANIDGGLIGGASLVADEFLGIWSAL